MSGRNMFYWHFSIGLISSRKYWSVAKSLVPVLKMVIQVKFYFHEFLTKIQKKCRKIEFSKITKK